MSYKLEKPYTNKEYANFIVEHNRINQRYIEETPTALYALEPNEMLGKDGVPVINPNYEEELAAQEVERRTHQIKSALYELDLQAIRPLRAILAGTQTEDDLEKIKEIETKAKELRITLSTLQ